MHGDPNALPGAEPAKPGIAGRPLPGIDAAVAAVIPGDTVGHREAEAGPFTDVLRREEGLEDPAEQLRRDAGAAVARPVARASGLRGWRLKMKLKLIHGGHLVDGTVAAIEPANSKVRTVPSS